MNLTTFTGNFTQSWRGFALALFLSASGCATVGHEFPAGQVQAIRIGESTQNEILASFGNPYRKGIDNGLKTWTYANYVYKLVGESETEDLVIKFDKKGVVSSYSYNSSKRSK
jgi:hypothetical protein